MSEKMTVHFVKKTGTVVGAATRVADSGQAAPGGEDVLVRGLAAVPLLVPGTELSTLVSDPDLDLLLQPRSYHVPPQGSAVVPLTAEVTSIALAFDKVTVGVGPGAATADEEVWVLIDGGPLVQPLVVTGTVLQGQTAAALPVALASGTYHMIALARGRQPLPHTDTLP